MKYVIFFVVCLISVVAHSQNLPAYGLDKVRIIQPNETVVAEIVPISGEPTVKPKLFYYWYSANAIHSSQGGFSGKLLNGQYTTYYPDKNLKEQGSFKKGLKDGIWKSWNTDGTLATMITWKRGSVVAVKSSRFWKKVHLFGKKNKTQDTLTSSKK
ncbi:toxin-antitoxin system YwqK family antitoxin [Mucilaginibacter sp. McL0603]|uniref:toxin-antitoxin system YwqK family antitoxin n=1 Tax=Mucilaginibacter sp. McL0603 TaxID=3415670 RepID=UPI003CF865D2